MGASSLSPSFGVVDGELSRGRSSHILHSMVKNNSALQLRLVMCGSPNQTVFPKHENVSWEKTLTLANIEEP